MCHPKMFVDKIQFLVLSTYKAKLMLFAWCCILGIINSDFIKCHAGQNHNRGTPPADVVSLAYPISFRPPDNYGRPWGYGRSPAHSDSDLTSSDEERGSQWSNPGRRGRGGYHGR